MCFLCVCVCVCVCVCRTTACQTAALMLAWAANRRAKPRPSVSPDLLSPPQEAADQKSLETLPELKALAVFLETSGVINS